MCLYSLHIDKSERRNARVGDTLTLSSIGSHHAFRGQDGKITCIKPGREVELTVQIDVGVIRVSRNEASIAQPNYGHTPIERLAAWQGKTVKAKFVSWFSGHAGQGLSADGLEMPDGAVVHLAWLKIGTTLVIPRKQRKDVGVPRPHRRKRNLEQVLGLDQIRADVPVSSEEKVS